MENKKTTLQEDFIKKLSWAFLVGFITFAFYALAGILPNLILGVLELQRKGYSEVIILVFFTLPVVGYTLWGLRKGLVVLARLCWEHFLEKSIKEDVASKLATALLQNIQTTPDEKLTGEVLVDKLILPAWEDGLAKRVVKFIYKTLINNYLFDIYKNLGIVLKQDNLEAEIYQKMKKIYEEKVTQLKTGNFLLDFLISWVLPFLIYLNIGLAIWYYFGA